VTLGIYDDDPETVAQADLRRVIGVVAPKGYDKKDPSDGLRFGEIGELENIVPYREEHALTMIVALFRRHPKLRAFFATDHAVEPLTPAVELGTYREDRVLFVQKLMKEGIGLMSGPRRSWRGESGKAPRVDRGTVGARALNKTSRRHRGPQRSVAPVIPSFLARAGTHESAPDLTGRGGAF